MSAGFRDSAISNNGQSATSTSIPFTIPATAVAGDVAFALLDVNGSTATVTVVPTGWALLRGPDVSASSTFECFIYYKIMAGTPGSISSDANTAANWTVSTTVKDLGIMVVVSGTDSGNIVDLNGQTTTGTTNTVLTAPSITTKIQNDFILEFFIGHTATVVNAAGTLSGSITNINFSSTNFAAAANLTVQAAYRTTNQAVPGSVGGDTITYVTTNPQQMTYTIAVTPLLNTIGNNYQFVKVGDGMSMSEKIR